MTTPGTPLACVLIAPLAPDALERELRELSHELELELFEDEPAGELVAGSDRWSAYAARRGDVRYVADELAEALAKAGGTAYVLGFTDDAASAHLEQYDDGEEPRRLDEPAIAFVERLLGRALPARFAGGVAPRTADDDPRVPLAAFGVPGPPPTTFAVRITDVRFVNAIACGSIDPRQREWFGDDCAAPRGLFDERIFGPLRRDPTGALRLGRWLDEHPRDRPQAARFGALALPGGVINPWALRTATGPTAHDLFALAYYNKVVVDGELVSYAKVRAGDAVLVGGSAVRSMIASGRLPDWTVRCVLDVLPVLPAGLRPAFDGQVLDATLLYDLVQRHVAMLERLRELGGAETLQLNARRQLQRAVDALIFDGARRHPELGWTPCDPDERPDLQSLRHCLLASPGWATAIADGIAANPERPFSKRWYGLAYLYQAWLEASGLELVGFDAEGAIDHQLASVTRVDRRARMFADTYGTHLAPLHDNVIHLEPFDDRGDVPHIDVYATAPRAELDGGRWIVTGGASARSMYDRERGAPLSPQIELAMKVPASISEPLLEHLMLGLRAVARFPFVNRTFLAPLQSVGVGKPIAPDSALTAFVFAEPNDALFDAMSESLPSTPRFVLAVGITDDEVTELADAPNRAAAVAALVARTRGVTDPARAPTR